MHIQTSSLVLKDDRPDMFLRSLFILTSGKYIKSIINYASVIIPDALILKVIIKVL